MNTTKLQSGDVVEVVKRLSSYHRVGARVTVTHVSDRGDFKLAAGHVATPGMSYGFAYRSSVKVVKRVVKKSASPKGINSQDIAWPQAYAPPCHAYPVYPKRWMARAFCRSAREDGTQRCEHCTCRTVVKYIRK